MTKPVIALLCGAWTVCDRCNKNEAKVQINVLSGQRHLCETCLSVLLEGALQHESPELKTEDKLCVITKFLVRKSVRNLKATVYFLTYGDGRIRTYLPGFVDGRVGIQKQNVFTEDEVMPMLQKNPCVIPVRLAMEWFGQPLSEFAI